LRRRLRLPARVQAFALVDDLPELPVEFRRRFPWPVESVEADFRRVERTGRAQRTLPWCCQGKP
jgi:hypothetical protein